jgi:hypothetical protein
MAAGRDDLSGIRGASPVMPHTMIAQRDGAGGGIHEGMKVALLAIGLLGASGCVRPAEGLVRDQAAAAFGCAEYALNVEEVGPDEYRAAGCGQELIYACKPTAPREVAAGGSSADESVMECVRRPE